MGIALGTTAGLLIRFGRRRPGLATGVALAILFAFASGPGRQFALDQVRWTGRLLRYLLIPWSISDDQISITGMIFGAIAGAVVADLAMYYPGDEDPHEPDTSPTRQRVHPRGHHRFTRWRVGLVCDPLPCRSNM